MIMYFYLLYFLAIIRNTAESAENHKFKRHKYCQALPDKLPLGQFDTKTGYEASPKIYDIQEQYDKETSQCAAVALWHLARHGTRYPTPTVGRKMSAVLPLLAQEIRFGHTQGRGCLTEEQADSLEDWVVPWSPMDVGQLHPKGGEEHEKLGADLKERFPQLFEKGWVKGRYEIEVTAANRTQQSARHFLRGLFGEEAALIELPPAKRVNWKLRAYDACPAWRAEVKDNPDSLKEQSLYRETPEFRRMLRRVSKRLGYVETMRADDLLLAYEQCRLDAAWSGEATSAWCAGFAEHDLQVLEHYLALKYYYIDGYGAPEKWRTLPCQALVDLREKFDAASSPSPSPSPVASLYFSHDHHLLQLYTLLGLHRPRYPLTHALRPPSSPYNVSRIAPFSSNLAFVLFKCGEGHQRLGALQQGVPVGLGPLCGGATCPWPVPWLQGLPCQVAELCAPRDEL